MADRRTVNPGRLVGDLISQYAREGSLPAVSPRQLGEATTLAAGMLAALGLDPAIEGDATDERVLAGRGLLEMLRAGLVPAGPEGGESGA